MIDLESSTLIEWDGLQSNADDSYINGATITGTLKDGDGTLLGQPDLSYVSGSNGKYQGYITPTMIADVAPCEELTLVLTATYGGYTGYRTFKETANYRGKK
jgi:hypothetical protein